jgi:hypothetical protein
VSHERPAELRAQATSLREEAQAEQSQHRRQRLEVWATRLEQEAERTATCGEQVA